MKWKGTKSAERKLDHSVLQINRGVNHAAKVLSNQSHLNTRTKNLALKRLARLQQSNRIFLPKIKGK